MSYDHNMFPIILQSLQNNICQHGDYNRSKVPLRGELYITGYLYKYDVTITIYYITI